MKQTKIIMGMPVSLEIVGRQARPELFNQVFEHFQSVDQRFSTYKADSEISQINRGLPKKRWSPAMKLVLSLCEATKRQTGGFFDIERNGRLDPSGLVKGWAIQFAAKILDGASVENYFLEVGGDIQARGHNTKGQPWRVGIRNPFQRQQNVRVIQPGRLGVATSGSYVRGNHVYNPHQPADKLREVASITVIGPNIYEADRMATAAYAMGRSGINFIESLPGFEGYTIDRHGIATMTSGFEALALC